MKRILNKIKIEHKQLVVLTVVFLMLVTVFVYGPVHRYEFVNYDDNIYVTENIHVRGGLTGANLLWAFQSLEAGFWQPLTWLSLFANAHYYLGLASHRIGKGEEARFHLATAFKINPAYKLKSGNYEKP